VSVSRHFLLQAPPCPRSLQKWFSRDHCCRGRSKPIDFKVAATAKSCGKVSHAAVKSFDRRGVSCKNTRIVQFSGGAEKCLVTQKTGKLFYTRAAVELNAQPVTNVAHLVELGGEVTRPHAVLTLVSKNCQPEGDTLRHLQLMQFLEQR